MGLLFYLKYGLQNLHVPRDLLMHKFFSLLYLFKGHSSPGVCRDLFLSSVQVSEILAIGLLVICVWTSMFFDSRGLHKIVRIGSTVHIQSDWLDCKTLCPDGCN